MKNQFRTTNTIYLMKMCGLVIVFLLHLYIARAVTDATYGVYLHIMSLVNLIVAISMFGMNRAIVKISAIQKISHLKVAFTNLSLLVVAVSIVLSYLTTFFTEYEKYYNFIGLVVLTIIVVELIYSYLIGRGASIRAEWAQQIMRPVLLISVIYYLIMHKSNVDVSHLLLAVSFVNLVTFLLYAYNLYKLEPLKEDLVQYKNMKQYVTLAMPLYIASLSQVVTSQSSTAIVGFYMSAEQVAYYATALRIGSMVSVILLALNSSIASNIAYLYRSGDVGSMKIMVTKHSRKVVSFAVIIFFLIIIFGEYALGLFGVNYKSGYWPLLIISVAHLINVATGPVGLMMSLCGKQKTVSQVFIISGILTVVLSLLLIPLFSIIGASLAIGIPIIITNLFMWYQIWIKDVLSNDYVKH